MASPWAVVGIVIGAVLLIGVAVVVIFVFSVIWKARKDRMKEMEQKKSVPLSDVDNPELERQREAEHRKVKFGSEVDMGRVEFTGSQEKYSEKELQRELIIDSDTSPTFRPTVEFFTIEKEDETRYMLEELNLEGQDEDSGSELGGELASMEEDQGKIWERRHAGIAASIV